MISQILVKNNKNKIMRKKGKIKKQKKFNKTAY